MKIKYIIYFYLNMSVSEADVQKVFKDFDIDGSGYIESKEIEKVCEMLGVTPTKDEIEALIKEADLDNDGKISYEEFKKAIMG